MPLNGWQAAQWCCDNSATTNGAIYYYSQSTISSQIAAFNYWSTQQVTFYSASTGLQSILNWSVQDDQGLWAQLEQKRKASAVLSQRTKKRLRREQREWDAMRARERKQHEEVQARAKALLTRNLTPAQRDSLERNGYFDLNIGGRHYRVRQGTHGNVRLVQDGHEVTSYCIQPNGVPTEDAMLAQKLLLETDEASFLRIANARQLGPAQGGLIIGRP